MKLIMHWEGDTYAREHMSDWTGDLDTQETSDAKKETEDASDQTSPQEYITIPS